MSGKRATVDGQEIFPGTQETFKRICSRFPKGITVVSARRPEDGTPVGMTVSAFTGVSLDPPTLLVCVREDSRCAQVLLTADFFCVNLLSEDQREISQRFASKPMEHRFAGLDWSPARYGPPVLRGGVGHFICERMTTVRNGDHLVVFGRMVEGSYDDAVLPLVYWASDYHCLAQSRSTAAGAT